jgi:hypothetical protein
MIGNHLNRCAYLRQNNAYLSYVLRHPSTKFLALKNLDCLCDSVFSVSTPLTAEKGHPGLFNLRRREGLHRQPVLDTGGYPFGKLPFKGTSTGTHPSISRHRRNRGPDSSRRARQRHRSKVSRNSLLLHRHKPQKPVAEICVCGGEHSCEDKGERTGFFDHEDRRVVIRDRGPDRGYGEEFHRLEFQEQSMSLTML